MNNEANPGEIVPQGSERLDLAVYAYRVLAVLRSLGPIECDAVLHAVLELNRASQVSRPPTASTDEPA